MIHQTMKKLLCITLFITLTGCVAVWGASHKVTMKNSNSVVIEYDRVFANANTMLQTAQKECSNFGKNAVLISSGPAYLGIQVNTYRCEEKPFAKSIVSAKQKTPTTAVPPRQQLQVNPINIDFPNSPPRPDDVAVIIGNADYSKGRDIPNVTPAYADAAGIKHYVKQALGIRDENIIFLKDATQADMISTFGSGTNPKGQLFNYVKAGKSRVFVYYSGHGAPGGEDGGSYIIPTDAQASLIDLNGYPLKTLYKNLGKMSAKSVTVVLEACFSGASQSGSVISKASPIYLKAKETGIPPNITVIAAGAVNQIASWEQDSSSSLFTKYFLKGMSGEADAKPYGNGDGKVGYDELGRYFKETLTYYARRYYGRDQTPQIVVGKGG